MSESIGVRRPDDYAPFDPGHSVFAVRETKAGQYPLDVFISSGRLTIRRRGGPASACIFLFPEDARGLIEAVEALLAQLAEGAA